MDSATAQVPFEGQLGDVQWQELANAVTIVKRNCIPLRSEFNWAQLLGSPFVSHPVGSQQNRRAYILGIKQRSQFYLTRLSDDSQGLTARERS